MTVGPTVGLIWAQASNGVIGKDGRLPWRLPEDLAHFKRTTMGHPVIMGRRTWESLFVQPLPGRRNLVVTRQAEWSAPGAEVCRSVDEAVRRCAGDDAWVIGGAQVYAAALPHADLAVVTELEESFDGDAYAPELGTDWQVVAIDPAEGWQVSEGGLRYRIKRMIT